MAPTRVRVSDGGEAIRSSREDVEWVKDQIRVNGLHMQDNVLRKGINPRTRAQQLEDLLQYVLCFSFSVYCISMCMHLYVHVRLCVFGDSNVNLGVGSSIGFRNGDW